MSNLTFDEKLLKEHTPEPLEGHNVVVFERVGEAGEKIHSVIAPGSARARAGFIRSVFGGGVHFFAYAVDASTERHLEFTEHVVLADHVNEFDVVFDLWYGVSDPRAAAGQRNKDPLNLVRRHAGEVIARDLALLPWNTVWDGFREAGEELVAYHLDGLNRFAGEYGIVIRSLRLAERLPENATAPARRARNTEWEIRDGVSRTKLKLSEVAAHEKVTLAEQESAQRIHQNQMLQRLTAVELERAVRAADANAGVEATLAVSGAEALGRVLGGINTPDELISALQAVGKVASVGGGMTAPIPTMVTSGSASAAGALPGAAPGRLGWLLGEIMASTERIRIGGQKRLLRAALLHLAAEVLTDDPGDGKGLAEYVRRARGRIESLDPAPSLEEVERLRMLADPDHLRSRLDD